MLRLFPLHSSSSGVNDQLATSSFNETELISAISSSIDLLTALFIVTCKSILETNTVVQ